MARVRLERDHRLGPLDAVEAGDLVRHQLRELFGLAQAEDRDEVPFPGHGVGLGDAVDVGELAAERRQRGPLGLDQDDRVDHAECVSPGSSTTTLDCVEDSTSDLNAWASVSIGGNVP